MNIPANTGWYWIKQGFALFRKRSGTFASIFTFYTLMLTVMTSVPFLGQIAPSLLAPFFCVIFMTACWQIERTNNVNGEQIRLLFASPTTRRVFVLGLIYLFVTFVLAVIFILILTEVGGLSLAELKEISQAKKPFTPTEQQTFGIGLATIITPVICAICFLPPLWFSAPLIVWRKMGVFQSMFYSFFSVWRYWKAFFTYLVAWMFILVLIPSTLSAALTSILGSLAVILHLIATLLISVVLYCSFYTNYVYIFGEPELP